MTRTVLQSFFDQMDNQSGWSDQPEVQLARICDQLFRLGGTISGHVADYLEASRTRRHPGGLTSYDLITRVDTPLHESPRGDYECVLHNGREPIAPESEVRPHINAKGYWMLTVVLGGQFEIQRYVNESYTDPTWIPQESLRPTDCTQIGPGDRLILSPDQIHRLNRVSRGAVSLTFRVLRGAGVYRDFIPHLKHYAVYERAPRSSRMQELSTMLRRLTI